MTVTIVADDLAGACDAGTLCAGKSPVPVAVWPDPAVAAPVSVVDTESRDLEAAEASRRVRRAIGPGARAGATVWFKKIDSTLRGHAGAELAALLRVTGVASALVCPAFPAQGRTVVDRQLFVNGEPRASVVDRLRPEVDRPLAWIPLGDVRAGGVALTARVMRLAGMVVVADARPRGAARLALAAAPHPGLALGGPGMPGRAELAVLTKAGGFGPPNLFVSLAREAGA